MKHEYKIKVTRDGRWWMIHVPEIDELTQARRLNEVKQNARELIAVSTGTPIKDVAVHIASITVNGVDILSDAAHVKELRHHGHYVEYKALEAAGAYAGQLTVQQVPVRDIAELLGISPQRVSQLTNNWTVKRTSDSVKRTATRTAIDKLFDDSERSDPTHAKFSESTFQYLNRVDQPAVACARSLMEEWFNEYPADSRVDLRNRFRDSDESQHVGAWWELYIHALYRRLGYDVAVHPKVAHSPKNPDFLVARGPTSMYIECKVVFPQDRSTENRTPGTQEWIYDCINEVKNRNFFIGLRYVITGTQWPKKAEITRPLERWLAALDPDTVLAEIEAHGESPKLEVQVRDWTLTYIAHPKQPEGRYKGGRLLGYLPATGGFVINDVERIHNALREKGRRFSRLDKPLDKPLIVAVLSISGFVDEGDMTDAVFGRKAVEYVPGDPPSVRLVRLQNGYWRGKESERGSRVSAVLFGQNIRPWSLASHLPRMWINPWASMPLDEADSLAIFTAEDDGNIISRGTTLSPRGLFGLPSEWPDNH